MDQKIDSNFQKRLFEHLFQFAQALKLDKELADSNLQRENQTLNKAREEIVNALNVYQKAVSGVSEFTNPKNQLNMEIDQNRKLEEIRKELEKSKSVFLLNKLNGNESAYISASNARKSGEQILQKIQDYHQAKSEASELIKEMRSKLEYIKNLKTVKYIKYELLSLENEVNLAKKHFIADNISDYI